MPRLIADQLRWRARAQGADPLVTYYDLSSGERTELSGVSMLNWVDKTSNLMADELLLEPGAVVDLRLAQSSPGHWITLVLTLAAWQVGAVVHVDSPAAPDLLVLGPDWEDQDRTGATAVLACTLHPLGLGFPSALPSDVLDFTLEVRGQSDHHAASPRAAADEAWVDNQRRLTHAGLVAVPYAESPARRLVQVSDPWTSVRDGLIIPVLTGGSAVLVTGDDPDRLARIVETERVDQA